MENGGVCLWCSLGEQVIKIVSRGFFIFSVVSCSGYAQASKIRIRLLSSSCRMWSTEKIMLYQSGLE